MLLTVPGLKDDQDDPIVEPDVPMRDDGEDKRFAKAYIHDEIPWMDLHDEVLDLMCLAAPSVGVLPADQLTFDDVDVPEDGMEACWFAQPEAAVQEQPVESVEEKVTVPEPAVETLYVSAPASQAMIGAPAMIGMLRMPEPVQALAQEAVQEVAVEDTEFTEAVELAVRKAVEQAVALIRAVEDAPVEEVCEAPVAEEAPQAVEEYIPQLITIEIPEEPVVEPVQSVEEVLAQDVQVPEEFTEAVEDIVEAAVPEPEIPVAEEITVIQTETEPAATVVEDTVTVTEDMPAVRFSFGSQEVRGNGWRVCFSF